MENNNESIFDQFHHFILAYWKVFVAISCIIVLLVTGDAIRNHFIEKYDAKQSEIYNIYTKSNREQQKSIASSMLKSQKSNYHVLIALWETKFYFNENDFNRSKEWLVWAENNNTDPVVANLIRFRMLNLCYQMNDNKCIHSMQEKLNKTSYASLALFIEAQSSAKMHKNQMAIEQLQQAMKKTDDKMLQLIYSTNIMALK